jgi:signal transduction histidine kinase
MTVIVSRRRVVSDALNVVARDFRASRTSKTLAATIDRRAAGAQHRGMNTNIAADSGYSTAIMNDNHIMTETGASSRRRRIIRAPFSRRPWAELGYLVATLPIAVAGAFYTVVTLANGPTWAMSASGLRRLAAGNRFFARALLGEDIPAPAPLRSITGYKVRTADGPRLAALANSANAWSRVWETKPGVTISGIPQAQITELAGEAGITIDSIELRNEAFGWYRTRLTDRAAWRARGYFGLKLPLVVVGFAGSVGCWLGGVFCLAFPIWWEFLPQLHLVPLVAAFFDYPACAAVLLFAALWLLHGVTTADLRLARGLLGPSTPAERIRALEQSRARVVDDSAARLRSIERDLHDGTQAQLVALAMKLGLAKEKLEESDLARVAQLVEDAHRGAVEAITDLRTLARGIHPPVLDKGLPDALATLASRSAVPVELVVDIPERPSDAIETIAYFSAAELLTNVAKHSGARHATLEAVHVPGLLRIRVSDDGAGGARLVADGGLRGLADRVRAVDGRLVVDSPSGGPTTITVELPSHA